MKLFFCRFRPKFLHQLFVTGSLTEYNFSSIDWKTSALHANNRLENSINLQKKAFARQRLRWFVYVDADWLRDDDVVPWPWHWVWHCGCRWSFRSARGSCHRETLASGRCLAVEAMTFLLRHNMAASRTSIVGSNVPSGVRPALSFCLLSQTRDFDL